MYPRLLAYFSHNKYRLLLFLLLAGATVMCVAIWRVRFEYSGKRHYAFLIWNLYLAWIPFLIAYLTYTITLKRRQVYILIPIAAFFWLLFFPNAPYMLTDFQHLAGKWHDLPVWYDVMMLVRFSFTGLMLGITSLFLMQEMMSREFGRWVGWGFVAVVACLRQGATKPTIKPVTETVRSQEWIDARAMVDSYYRHGDAKMFTRGAASVGLFERSTTRWEPAIRLLDEAAITREKGKNQGRELYNPRMTHAASTGLTG